MCHLSPMRLVSGKSWGKLIMTTTHTVPCADCQKALHKHKTLENLYCGHNQIIAFRFPDSHIEYIAVNSTEEAIKMLHDSEEQSQPLSSRA
jgi:hypothetical protein